MTDLTRGDAAELLYDVSVGDWRDVTRRIELPTLAITYRVVAKDKASGSYG